MSDAASQDADIVCFPEAYVPGLRGLDFDVEPFDAADEGRVLGSVAGWARQLGIATILGTEHLPPTGPQIVAFVFGRDGRMLGHQTKNQIDPAEEGYYVAGDRRQLFELDGVVFGITICHEGFRYPESVRWSAVRGARLVFHSQCTGSDRTGVLPVEWGARDGAYYEKAMMMRSLENTIYVAGVNYAFRYPDAATSVIDPAGRCQAYLPYGEEGVLVEHLDLDKATGLLAKRYAPDRYLDA
jgi:predicted amidohydrolase